jgi:hypothetical protein
VRFLIPPFFLLLSIAVGAHFSGIDLLALASAFDTDQLVVIGTAIGASTLPVGYLLTSVSILLLQGLAKLRGCRTYETCLPDEVLAEIWPRVKTSLRVDRKWELYAVATFDHELVPGNVHDWIQRRWSSFHISAHSCTAILLSHFSLAVPRIRLTVPWFAFSLLLLLALGINANAAWHQVMRMLEFQTTRGSGTDDAG